MLKDIRYALRTLRQNPGFAATAILSIALALGATSAIFTVADGLVLRPLQVPDPSRVVTLRARTPSGNFSNISYADYVDFRDKSRSFDALVAYNVLPAGLAKDAATQPQLKTGFVVTGNFFSMLGVRPAIGRGFGPDDDRVPGKDAVVVLSHETWEDDFGSDPAILSRKVRLNGVDFAIVGVMPESMSGLDFFLRPAFYVPAAMASGLSRSSEDLLTNRARREFFVKGRLKDGVSIESAGAEIVAIAQSLQQSDPATNRAIGSTVMTELQARHDFDRGDQELVLVLSGLAIVLLSIGCANVANLMLNRGRARTREVAVRVAIGASRLKIVRQLMAESLLIALAGGALGLLIAQSAVEVFSKIDIPGDLPIRFTFSMDGRVLAFTFAISVVSAVLFGLMPAWQASKADLSSSLKAGDSDLHRKRFFGRSALVVVQMAGSLVLLIVANQFYEGIHRLISADHGFRIDHRITMKLAPAEAGLTPERTEQFYRTLVESTRNVAGIRSAALSASLPMTTGFGARGVIPEGYQFPVGQESERVLTDYVSDGYFDTFGMRILAGRAFLPTDRVDAPLVAVVNQEFARQFFKGDAIGKRFRLQREGPWIAIVGMTVTGHHITAFEPPLSFLYLPVSQHPQQRMTLIAETFGDPAAMAGPLRDIIRSIDPNVPLFSVRTMEDLFQQRAVKVGNLLTGVVGVLGAMGFVLALIGLYAVVSYQVSRRTREIGIRMAIGAARLQVVKMVLKHATGMALAGIGIGTLLGVATNSVLNAAIDRWGSQLFPLDIGSVAAIVIALLGTTFLAAAIPARHASRIDPQRALRQE